MERPSSSSTEGASSASADIVGPGLSVTGEEQSPGSPGPYDHIT